MKTIKKIIVIALLYFPVNVFSQIKSAELTAAGLTCSMCSKAIYTALMKLPIVEKIDVDLNKSVFLIQFKKDAHVELDDLKKKVEGAGFSVVSLKVKAQFNDAEVFTDAHIKLNGTNLHFLNVDKQKLNGEVNITIVDKGFIPDKMNAKYGKYTTMECFKTGKMAACCSINKEGKAERIYHVTII
ncbi:MAG: heavy-metal-associated domain-containing protein [Bacteroidetes bacterium]|nr:heavy-metal-associated domain-containing protein [Bacteroidota bacterium]